MSSSADIVFYGGSAGGGKSWMLLAEPIRHLSNPGFGAVIFRREMPQITNEGGLWDQANDLYPHIGGVPIQSPKMQYRFPSGAKITFAHLQHLKTVKSYDGSQVPLFLFDELQHFLRRQFFYILTRNRSLCGVKPYVRASMNPCPPDDPIGGWLHELVGWYLDEDGYADPDKSGVIRWFVVKDEQIIWAGTREELVDQYPGSRPKSFTFILSRLKDNKILCEKDPDYKANLEAQPTYERDRLLGDEEKGGNWFAAPSAGTVFEKGWFEIVHDIPRGEAVECVFTDFAATKKEMNAKDPDYLAITRVRKVDGIVYIIDVTRGQWGPAEGELIWKNTTLQHWNSAQRDGIKKYSFRVRWEQEPASAGKRESHRLAKLMQNYGFAAKGVPARGDKVLRATPFASAVKAGNVKLLAGAWNDAFITEHHSFPDGAHDDQVDSASGAYDSLASNSMKQPRKKTYGRC